MCAPSFSYTRFVHAKNTRRTKERNSCFSSRHEPSSAERAESISSIRPTVARTKHFRKHELATCPRERGNTLPGDVTLGRSSRAGANPGRLSLVPDGPRSWKSDYGRRHSTRHIFPPAASFDAHLRVGRTASWLTSYTHSEDPERGA